MDLGPEDRVLEIGSGPGALTRALLPGVSRLVSVEIDERFAPVGEELAAAHPHFTFLQGDFLELAPAATPVGTEAGPWKVVANIPYYITTPILEQLLGPWRPYLSDLYLLMQAEVAQRICAEGQRDSGSLTLYVAYWGVPRMLLHVPGRVFQPPARVDSALLHIALRAGPAVAADETLLFRVIHAAFTQRRKMLRSSLRTAFSEAALTQAFARAGVRPDSRPESLHLRDFSRLAEALEESAPAPRISGAIKDERA